MSRYDKYDPKTGGSRAYLAANFGYTGGVPDFKHADLGKLFAVGVNASGQVGKFGSAGFTGFAGVMILTRPKAAGDVVDYMTDGDIIDLVDAEILAADTLAAGQRLYADVSTTTGQLTAVKAAGDFYVGRTMEMLATGARLVVRCMFVAEAGA
jgi:hypothetical protein